MDNAGTWESKIWVDGTKELKSGEEWDSKTLFIKKGSIVTIDLLSNERVYFKISKYEDYKTKTKNGSQPYDFPFGSDESTIDEAVKISSDENYILIMRLSVFNDNAKVKLRVEVISPTSKV